jgi:lipopolysaccharide transport system ATP-binding protein
MSQPIIQVSNVSKKYRLGKIGMTSFREEFGRLTDRLRGRSAAATPAETEFWALRDVSFDINPGEVVGVIGRNGAGKSTLLKILSRITEPTTGDIRLRGRLASLLEVGTGFHPELSGRENIFLNGAILGMRKTEIASKLDEIVAFSEIGKFLDTPVKRYSSGMYVRLAFAVAAHLEPEILIVDEVLAVGDAQFQRKCIGRMQDISKGDGRTILFVSHSMAAIRRLCSRCIVLDAGRLDGVFPIEEAIQHYLPKGNLTMMDVNVADRKRDWGSEGKIARITRIRVPAHEGLRFGDPFSIELTLDVRETIPQAMVGFAMNTVEGHRVMTLDSDSNGKTFALERGQHVVTLSLDRLPVSPGRYYCGAAIGGSVFYDIIDNFAEWEVHPGANDWESDRSFGGCRLKPEVKLAQTEPRL